MATSVSLIKATMTNTSTLFSKLLRSTTHSHSMAASYTSRSLKTMVPLHYPNSDKSDDSPQDIKSFIENGRTRIAKLKEALNKNDSCSSAAAVLMNAFYCHPFQKEGPECPFEIKEDEYKIYARIDMPGVGEEAVKVWIEKNELHFKGEVVEKNPEIGNVEFVRKFSSSFNIDARGLETDKLKFVVKNGVLRIVVPKLLNMKDMGKFSQVKVEF